MTDQPPLHPRYLHYSELPYSLRVLYTATLLTLGLGYLFALLNVYFTYAGRAGGNPWVMTEQDLVVAYSGSGTVSRLEGALRGPMSTMLPPDEMHTIIAWAQSGADQAGYDRDVRPIVDKRCMICHDGSNPHIPNLLRLRQHQEGHRKRHRREDLDAGARIAHSYVRRAFHLLHHGADVQQCLRPAGMVQVCSHCTAVSERHGGRELLVHHQDLPSFWVGRNIRGHGAGRVLRLHVGGDHVSALAFSAASDGCRATRRRYSQLALTGARPGLLQAAKAELALWRGGISGERSRRAPAAAVGTAQPCSTPDCRLGAAGPGAAPTARSSKSSCRQPAKSAPTCANPQQFQAKVQSKKS